MVFNFILRSVVKSIKYNENVLHLPNDVGGNPYMISKTMNQLGISSSCLVLNKNPLYKENLYDFVIYDFNDCFLIREIKRFISLSYILFYNVIFLNFGSTLFTPFPKFRFKHESGVTYLKLYVYSMYRYLMFEIELFLLKLFKRKVIVQYQGSDCRLKFFCKNNFDFNRRSFDRYTRHDHEVDTFKIKQIKKIKKIATNIYALNPDLLHILPESAQFLPYSHICLKEWKPFNYLPSRGNSLNLIHCPTDRDGKGTSIIIEVVKLINHNYNDIIKFNLIENTPRINAKSIFLKSDILIDQLHAGWYGGLAVEFMALNKPVVCYLRETDFQFLPKEMVSDLPIINANSSNLYHVLEKLIRLNTSQIVNIGIRSRKYVEKWHDPCKVTRFLSTDNGIKI